MILWVSSPAHLSARSLQAANRHNSRHFLPWEPFKGMNTFTQVCMMKGTQSSTSNIPFPFSIRSLCPEEGGFKFWSVKLQSKELGATPTLQFRAPCCLQTISCRTVLPLCPPSLLGNHSSCLGVTDREKGTPLCVTPKEEGKLS